MSVEWEMGCQLYLFFSTARVGNVTGLHNHDIRVPLHLKDELQPVEHLHPYQTLVYPQAKAAIAGRILFWHSGGQIYICIRSVLL